MKNNSIFKTPEGKNEILSYYDTILSRWPVPYEIRYLPTRLGNTHIIISGNEALPPLILLHGAASNAVSWIGEVSEYSRFFRVYALDIPGDPGKSAQIRTSWQGMGYAEWMDDVVTSLGIKKASLVGISQGGWTAIRFASCYPDKVNKLILLAPAGIVPTKLTFILKAVSYTAFGRRGVNRLNKLVFGKIQIHSEALKFMNIIMTNFKTRIDKEYIFKNEELIKLNMPVLLFCGEHDIIRSSKAVENRLRKFVPELYSLIIPDMGHVLVNLTDKIIPFIID